jgi:hypothetical protein
MTRCRVIARGKMNTCLVEFEDGFRVTTSRNHIMKFETMQKRLSKRANQAILGEAINYDSSDSLWHVKGK